MSALKDHKQLINKPFNVDIVIKIMTDEELAILKKYGNWMMSLYKGEISPLNNNHKLFIEMMKDPNPPKDTMFNIFWRYLKRQEILKNSQLNDTKTLIKDDRDDWKKIRRSRY